MEQLKQLYTDKATMIELRNLFDVIIREEAVTRTLERESVVGIADAKEIIDGVFNKLDEMFAPEVKVNKDNQAL